MTVKEELGRHYAEISDADAPIGVAVAKSSDGFAELEAFLPPFPFVMYRDAETGNVVVRKIAECSFGNRTLRAVGNGLADESSIQRMENPEPDINRVGIGWDNTD